MNDKHPTFDEFITAVRAVAAECGYGWVLEGRHHPEDMVMNLTPVMQAYAAGWTDGYKRGVKR